VFCLVYAVSAIIAVQVEAEKIELQQQLEYLGGVCFEDTSYQHDQVGCIITAVVFVDSMIWIVYVLSHFGYLLFEKLHILNLE